MTEQELISKLQELKQIKPNADWVSLSKANIFSVKRVASKPAYQWSFSNVLGGIFQRRMAFAFAVLMILFVGVAGVLNYNMMNAGVKVASVNSTADTLAVNTLVKDFQEKSQILADAVKDKSQNSEVAIKEVKAVASKLTNNVKQNPKLAKVIALEVNNNKTLLDVPGGNNTTEANSLYKTLDESLIEGLNDTALTPEQEIERTRIIAEFKKGENYPSVLTAILLLNVSRDSNAGEAN